MRKICSYGSVGVPVGNHRRYPEKLKASGVQFGAGEKK
jgi:hypothetical protein